MPLFNTGKFLEIANQILTLDYHVGGEPIRLVVDGLPEIPGATINDKRIYIGENFDFVRLLLTREPRGHRDMFAGIITRPVNEGSGFGIVFMDARRYPYMCGHGVIGAVTAFIESGSVEIQGCETELVVDSPSGPVSASVRIAEDNPGRVESVAIRMESAFVFQSDCSLKVDGLGTLKVDICFAGGFFVMVSVDQLGMSLSAADSGKLAEIGMTVIEAANRNFQVRHPVRTYIDTIDVAEFYDLSDSASGRGKNFVVLGEGHVDRSPCGTGTSAKMALLHRRGLLRVGERFVNEGLLGTKFEGRIATESFIGDLPVIVPEIRGSAHATGLHRFITTIDDPLPEGFLI
jgi:proline racemase/trans-L-3-hydroxyproline dehydratase